MSYNWGLEIVSTIRHCGKNHGHPLEMCSEGFMVVEPYSENSTMCGQIFCMTLVVLAKREC